MVIAVFTPMSRSSRVGPGIILRMAQIDRNIRQSAAKSQESIMYYNNVWRIRIYQSSRSGLLSGLQMIKKRMIITKTFRSDYLSHHPVFIPAERMNRRDASVLSGKDSFTLV